MKLIVDSNPNDIVDIKEDREAYLYAGVLVAAAVSVLCMALFAVFF